MRATYKNYYRAARRPLEWFAIGLGRALIPPLSMAALPRLANALADLAYRFDRRGNRVARANLRLMFGDRMTPPRERAIVRRSYRNMVRVLLNIFWMSRDTRARMERQVAFAPGLFEEILRNTPAVLVSAHFGNWEILSQACVVRGLRVLSVAKEIGSPEMTARLIRLRSTLGQEIVTADGAIRPMLRAVKEGKCIGLIVDQHTHAWKGGTWVKLFGVPAGISLAPATLSRKCGVPIVFAWSRPLRDGRYRIEPGQIFPPDAAADDAARTQQLASAFERIIRRHPSLWCLNYRRWRYILPGDDPARYPFYAHPLRPPPAAAPSAPANA